MSSPLRAFLPVAHEDHRPRWDFSDGHPPVEYPEVPARVAAVMAGFERARELAVERVTAEAEDAVASLHDADYRDFLGDITAALQPDEEYIPSIFHGDLSKGPVRFRGGMFTAEIGTPITPATVAAALNSAEAARRAAEWMRASGEDALALCRPPGHHAGRRRYGGYCFFNNAYIAASVLSAGGGRCAVLDVDYHLGDGSVEFASEQAPYFSLHADPWANYPHLDARWDGHRRPHVDLTDLPAGVDGDGYIALLDDVLGRVDAAGADTIVLSLGFDTAATDAIQDAPVGLDAPGFEAMGARLARRRERVLILLEGGYDVAGLAGYAEAFARGFRR